MIQAYEELQYKLERLLQKRKTAVDRVAENDRKHQGAYEKFGKERSDVEQLEEQSLATFMQNLFGTYEKKLAKEKQEQITAKVELDTATALVVDSKELLSDLDEEIDHLRTKTASLREELKATDENFIEKITQKEHERFTLKQEMKELDEAIRMGERVLQEINNVLNELDSANSMATWDMFSDSFFIDIMKYDKIDKAESKLTQLERTLDRYQKELKDVDFQTALAYEELGQMSRAFDIFFDNIFSDWNTRDTIRQNITMLEDMMVEVDDIQVLLFERETTMKEEIEIIEEYL